MEKQNIKLALMAEYLGSLFLLMVVNGVVIMLPDIFLGSALIGSVIAVPAILFVIIELFGPISGAHFNPLVTLIMYFEKKITGINGLKYVVVQTLGGLSGIFASHVMFYHESGGLWFISEVTRTDFTYVSEIIVTFMLILAVLILTKIKTDKSSFIIPLLVGANILSTSSTMFANPQVTFARMFTHSMAGIRPLDGFIFIIMQLVGTLLAYVVYKFAFKKNTAE